MAYKLVLLEEPELVFGHGQPSTDPRAVRADQSLGPKARASSLHRARRGVRQLPTSVQRFGTERPSPNKW